jgi:uncharacterized protein YecE (DUF72 family)
VRGQLDLFSSGEPAVPEPAPLDFSREHELARCLPDGVYFGTSSWTFTGWAGLVYPAGTTEAELQERGLELYTRYPLFRTVGIDRSYYRPLAAADLEKYASQLSPGFRCVSKVWSQITSAVDPRTRRPNPGFLQAGLFEDEVLPPIERHFAGHAGPFVFEIAPMSGAELLPTAEFEKRLERFLGALPRGFQYAVELRNRELMTRTYLEILRAHGAAHVLNFWERMPGVGEQLDVPGVLGAGFAVARLLIPPGRRYAERKRELAPFDRVVAPEARMRNDVVRLVQACLTLGKQLFVIVNNKAEGSSPLTIRGIAEELAKLGGR